MFKKMPNVLRSKCLVVGDSTVGKTALIQVFNSDNTFYPKNYTMTCGVDLVVKTVNVPDTNDVVELYFYDSSGKETYLDMMQKLWHNPSMWALVFDVTNEDSFNNISSWLQKLQDLKPAVPPTGVLLGNKTDIKERRKVYPKAALEFAKKNGLQYFECSAKDMTGVDEPFFYLVNEWHKLYVEQTEIFKTMS